MQKLFSLALLVGLLLSACASGKTASPATQPAAPEVLIATEPVETAAATQTALPTQTLPPTVTQIPTQAAKTLSNNTGSMPGCTAKSLFPTPDPTLEALFPAVSETDWSRGPETASVTLIEYSDFQ